MEFTLNNNQNPTVVENDVVVSMDYTLTVDGEVVDSSEGSEPIDFLQGYQNIVPGLEKAVYGMKTGESKHVVVSAAEGYGEMDEDAFVEIPRKDFPEDIPLEIGLDLQVRNDDGTAMEATIADVTDDMVKLDFNHPLAGKELLFDIKIVGLRAATEEELEHGHVHGEDYDEEEFEEEFEEIDVENLEEDDEEEA